MEYWIRLNKTVDVASECLRRQGRSIEDPAHEVTMMFVKHCPDQSLCNVFKYKSADKWTAGEIQERLDEHLQERKSRAITMRSQRPGSAVYRAQSQCVPNIDASGADEVLPQMHFPPPVAPPMASAFDADCMKRLVCALDRLVTQQTQVPVNFSPPTALPQPPKRACRVCGTNDHSTLSHCKRENRCLKCLSPGHWKKDCPVPGNQYRPHPSTAPSPQNQTLNG
ncbi:unnamed protein product [Knipowitschia caucasica]|uniref:CCHC-type domain-containing protein n=1 Tax=Knipowitschia caucasica TaxID=637954 RepID=A0AAV2LTF3_KNICA